MVRVANGYAGDLGSIPGQASKLFVHFLCISSNLTRIIKKNSSVTFLYLQTPQKIQFVFESFGGFFL